uniref:Uncharacterized protein n=1 Tax=Anopheles coluzzii TaxID=1518534 RepID=A0A8W7Q2F3_ANOCL
MVSVAIPLMVRGIRQQGLHPLEWHQGGLERSRHHARHRFGRYSTSGRRVLSYTPNISDREMVFWASGGKMPRYRYSMPSLRSWPNACVSCTPCSICRKIIL